MDSNAMDNDTRGWVMCAFSGLACIFGASVICIDIPIRLIPSKRHFRIQESNAFLASSLSLSFGVMLFSALYSMLPSAMRYLARDNWDEHKAGFLMMGCFIGGFFGIQVISRVLHRYMPSHVVDCDHTHENFEGEEHAHHGHSHSLPKPSPQPSAVFSPPHMVEMHSNITETTPLIPTEAPRNGHIHTELVNGDAAPAAEAITHFHGPQRRASTQIRQPSINVRSRVMSFFTDTKANCDEDGPCFGYSDPCGQECFKHIGTRSALSRNGTLLTEDCVEACEAPPLTPRYRVIRAPSHPHDDDNHHHHHHAHAHNHSHGSDIECPEDVEAQHHHHVPTNGFLSIGLQTVIAIALHKFPEGFITYATNHANPSLGFSVFMALFVHNIAEGFAMALPLYMALGSRVKAIFWSSLLGGFSQPLGAAVAVAWFKLAKRSNFEINSTAYACLFAATAGIMVSVALQLFVESLSLNHNRNLSIFFAFLGMTLLGISNALVSH
ncbi:Zinc/iron permease [Chaetomium tenue]|uniref:Zinc/iron permease n=1 Tax=Chaetomium tenue TaxID=1854479 RepID=A0ACB7P3I7_9PEZI|nr:Zinc/iron permease [Chaetomium globosum]